MPTVTIDSETDAPYARQEDDAFQQPARAEFGGLCIENEQVMMIDRLSALAASLLMSLVVVDTPTCVPVHRATCLPFDTTTIDTIALRRHISALAADSMMGRAPGTVGHRRAANYIEATLRTIGVPGWGAGARLRSPMPLQRIRLEGAELRIERAGRTVTTVRAPSLHMMGRSVDAFRSFSGELVALGSSGMAKRRLNAGASVNGRVVVIEAGGGAVEPLLPRLEGAGAVGVVVLVADSSAFLRLKSSRGVSRLVSSSAPKVPGSALPMVVVGGPKRPGRSTMQHRVPLRGPERA